MAGKHRRQSQAARVVLQVPRQRRSGIELVDGDTHVRHGVSFEAMLAGRQAGSYDALCGQRVLAGSMVDRGKWCCRECER